MSRLSNKPLALATTAALLTAALLTAAPAVRAEAVREWLYLNAIGKVFVLDAATFERVQTIPCKGMTEGVAFDDDAKRLFVISGQRELIEVFDRATGKPLRTYSFSKPGQTKARVFSMALVGNTLYAYINTTRFDGWEPYKQDRFSLAEPEIAGVDLTTGKKVGRVGMPLGILNVQPIGKGDKLYAIGRDLWEVDLKAWKKRRVVPLQDPAMDGEGRIVAYAEWVHGEPSGGMNAHPYWTVDPIVGKTQTGILTIDGATGAVDHFEFGPPVASQFPFSAVVMPGRKRAFMTMNKLFEVDMGKRRVTRVQDYGTTYYAITASADGKKLWMSSSGATLAEVDADTLKLTRKLELPAEVWDVTAMPAPAAGAPAGRTAAP